MESVYSAASISSSSKHGGTKRPIPNKSGKNIGGGAGGISEIRQRVLSARMLRYKTIQNQLTLAQQQIHDLEQENRSLNTTIRRQEKALDKYDNANAELPRLLKNHQEEIRMWNAKSKGLHKQILDLTTKLKQKENLLLVLSDQNQHLSTLNRDKHLEEREKLFERVKDLEHRLVDRDNEIKLLARKNQLDTKMLKSQLHQEQCKNREVQLKFDRANLEITRLNLLELNNGRNILGRQKSLRESHSAATNLSYGYHNNYFYDDEQHLKVHSSSTSFHSKSPQSFRRNEVLYEREEEIETKIEPDHDDNNLKEDTGGAVVEEKCITKLVYETTTTVNQEDLIAQFQVLNRQDIMDKEQILDEVCESVIQGNSSKKQIIDPKSKTKLLAALKAIDDNESFES